MANQTLAKQLTLIIRQMVLKSKNKSSLLLLLSLFSYSCVEEQIKKKISIKGFDSENWIRDSLGCWGNRNEMARLLEDSMREQIVGKNKESLILFLGEPNLKELSKTDSIFTYFVGKDKQCYDSLWREKRFPDAETIFFFINSQNKVTGMTGPVIP